MIGDMHLIRPSVADRAAVQQTLDYLDSAHASLVEAANYLGTVKAGFDAERSKLIRSAEGIRWEREAVANRLAEIEGRGKRRGRAAQP